MKYEIRDNLTDVNFTKGRTLPIQFIVVHFTANNGDTAKDNTDYFKSVKRGSSAGYFVDENPIIWRCVRDEDTSWHSGTTGTYFHPKCRNSNSIGIEMCSRHSGFTPPKTSPNPLDSGWYLKPETEDNCAQLVADLMIKYNIPISNVLRHYDVTRKPCPGMYVRDPKLWENFKKLVLSYYNARKNGDELSMTQYEELKAKIEEQDKNIQKLTAENEILKQSIGWNSNDPEEPALYSYNDSNLAKISPDANKIIGKLIASGKLSVDKNGKFAPLSKAFIRLLIILNR